MGWGGLSGHGGQSGHGGLTRTFTDGHWGGGCESAKVGRWESGKVEKWEGAKGASGETPSPFGYSHLAGGEIWGRDKGAIDI